MKPRQRILLLAAMLFSFGMMHAEWNDSIRWKGEVEADLGGGKHNPLWFASDNYGVTSIKKNSGYVRLGAFHDLDKSKRFSWGAGLELVGGWNQLAPFKIQQAYGEVKYRCLNALVGQKEFCGEFADSRISQGNLLYSGNAMPIPQVRLGIFDYADVWGCKGWFGVKGYIAFGKYTDANFEKHWVGDNEKRNKGVLYHSKGIWLKFGNEKKFPLTFELGLEMATQFGGSVYLYYPSKDNPKPHYHWMHNPTGFKDWLKAIFPTKASSDNEFIGEVANVQGNFLGTWDMALSWRPADDWYVKLYYQHFYEDQSMLVFDYPWKDGFYGVEAKFPKNPFVSRICYEYLYTKYQSGPVLHDKTPEIPEQVSGGDGYFNNLVYQGWMNWGMGVGSPLIIAPVYNEPHQFRFLSTRVIAHHVGFEGNPLPELRYRVKLSYVQSWGMYNNPYPDIRTDFSGLLEVGWSPKWAKGWEGTLGIAGDKGDLIGDSFGVKIKISKTGWLFKPKKKKEVTL